MARKSRWMTWIIEASADRQIPLPWALNRLRKQAQKVPAPVQNEPA